MSRNAEYWRSLLQKEKASLKKAKSVGDIAHHEEVIAYIRRVIRGLADDPDDDDDQGDADYERTAEETLRIRDKSGYII